MGGDNAPDIVVNGVAISARKYKNAKFLFFGDKSKIENLLSQHKRLSKISEIVHTDEAVMADDKPSFALRKRKNSSMNLAIKAVADGNADCVVSAGNTGALMLMALFGLKPLSQISRPAIASYYPTMRANKHTVLLDMGANLQCSAKNLVEFAFLGSTFAQVVLNEQKPVVSLLNIGSEEMKGKEELKEAFTLLSDIQLPGSFNGFAEGDNIMEGSIDVVVTDGFTGNVALKTSEGTAKLISLMLKSAFKSSPLSWLGYPFMLPALYKLKKRIDPRRYNGGVFLGLQGLCVKSHGGTDEIGFSNAINVGIKMIEGEFNARLADTLGKVDWQGYNYKDNGKNNKNTT